jgi:hypothetical protein
MTTNLNTKSDRLKIFEDTSAQHYLINRLAKWRVTHNKIMNDYQDIINEEKEGGNRDEF